MCRCTRSVVYALNVCREGRHLRHVKPRWPAALECGVNNVNADGHVCEPVQLPGMRCCGNRGAGRKPAVIGDQRSVCEIHRYRLEPREVVDRMPRCKESW